MVVGRLKKPEISVTIAKNGRRMMYIRRSVAGGWQRIGLDSAELLLATGKAKYVPKSKRAPGYPV